MDHRASGTPVAVGASQAIRLIATTTLGGKAGRTPASGLFLQPREAVLEEAMAPFADDLPRGIEPCRDLVVAQATRREEHDLGADDISIR
tara:strand:- start:297 stop:566 length:270 start_codon:yes stop_codon:yes gene_type:complete